MRIVLTGGGTGGSVAPLLAIYQEIKSVEIADFLFVGGKGSLERELTEENDIPFQSITSGKLRRYFDPRNFLTPLNVIVGFFQSLAILGKWKPDIVISAGSFVAVPVVWAAWLLRKPIVVHQQDLLKGLANKLMAPLATKITVTFSESLKDFPHKKAVVTGNPVRKAILSGDRESAKQLFSLNDLPVVLILGGGTGALSLNKVVTESLSKLLEFCQIIHIAGKGKNIFQDANLEDTHRPDSVEAMLDDKVTINYKKGNFEKYHAHEFLNTDELKHAFSVADIVVTRAGLSTLSELAILAKPIIIVPLPDTHQEKNAKYFASKNAALILNQKIFNTELFTNFVYELLQSKSHKHELSKNISNIMSHDAGTKVVSEIKSILHKDESS
ncbi:UDP-N-acetylglucosamine--N-acetylmuramyl-(pentapeptide) pyrophosphoryl-undecaprenol N-acetylglucosamine transferase [Patescibacteria group bacterium]|nr:UDP-N-acetylglucosamine--N-acetylmuramyl-(pentapeptide) pyrophosphoryl-undecaprenol N-acetylglucosamine transferase [Patescibacteria group bacterium]MBU1952364.1 UDP-N-acetylglucosamine--N-acetylmuramyl-(pentapeptide) pyrophosphoryl-undecaprenol N-acetylglucosamine transferase [Patescibacteria group bacterium]